MIYKACEYSILYISDVCLVYNITSSNEVDFKYLIISVLNAMNSSVCAKSLVSREANPSPRSHKYVIACVFSI
jgi:hypothetical protein